MAFEIAFRIFQNDQKTFPFVLTKDLIIRHFFLLDVDAVFFRQMPQRFAITQPFDVHNETDGIAGFAATKTFVDSLTR